MNTSTAIIADGFIRDLYLANNREVKEPILQILDFEESEIDSKEIMYFLFYLVYGCPTNLLSLIARSLGPI
jgi:hypothetical protein